MQPIRFERSVGRPPLILSLFTALHISLPTMTKRKYAEYQASKYQPPTALPSLQMYRNRSNILETTYTSPRGENVVALRTKQSEAYGREATFTASRTLLAKDSSVFVRMFEEKTASSYDGNPLFFVEDDPKDLQDFLLALHDYCAYTRSSRWTNGHSIGALLRLSKRYKVQHLVDRTLEYLTQVRYPIQTLEAYQQNPWLALVYMEEIAILNAVAKIEYQPLIPLLTYRAAISWSLTELINCQIRVPSAPGRPWFVTQACRSRVIRMHCSLSAWFWTVTERMLRKTSAKCVDREACKAALRVWRDKTVSFMADDNGLLFDIFLTVAYAIDDARGVCTECKERVKRTIGNLQQDAWDKLPVFVGMGSWEDVVGTTKKEEVE